MKVKIEALKGKRVQFYATHLVEFFTAPLPVNLDGEEISTGADLFRSSHMNGFDEIFLANGKVIDGDCEGKKFQFDMDDFLRWQLERVNENTLWQLIDKTGASVTEILDGNAEYEKDSDYDPEAWLNVYCKDEYPGRGLAYIKRLRQESPDEFYSALIKAIKDDTYGVFNREWYESEIGENLDDVRSSYGEWVVPLMIVSTGKFFPYISTDIDDNLMMDDYKLTSMYVRNYDEGTPL